METHTTPVHHEGGSPTSSLRGNLAQSANCMSNNPKYERGGDKVRREGGPTAVLEISIYIDGQTGMPITKSASYYRGVYATSYVIRLFTACCILHTAHGIRHKAYCIWQMTSHTADYGIRHTVHTANGKR